MSFIGHFHVHRRLPGKFCTASPRTQRNARQPTVITRAKRLAPGIGRSRARGRRENPALRSKPGGRHSPAEATNGEFRSTACERANGNVLRPAFPSDFLRADSDSCPTSGIITVSITRVRYFLACSSVVFRTRDCRFTGIFQWLRTRCPADGLARSRFPPSLSSVADRTLSVSRASPNARLSSRIHVATERARL